MEAGPDNRAASTPIHRLLGDRPFTAVALVERTRHSENVLYEDGTVILVGSNPGDGSFDMRISIYKPPQRFHSGRPTLNAPISNQWAYGTTQPIIGSNDIASAELIKPAAVTHSSDPNQRLIDVSLFRPAPAPLRCQPTTTSSPRAGPRSGRKNANGPSIAQWVHIS